MLVLPADAALSTPDVYREADRLGLTRPHAALERRVDTRQIHNDLQDAARSLCPAIDAALDTARAAGADHAIVSGSGPTVVGLFLGADGSARARKALGAWPRAFAAEPVGEEWAAGDRRLMHPFPLAGAIGLAVFLVVRRRHLGRATLAVGALAVAALALWGFGVVEPPNLTKLIEDVGTRLGKWTYLLVGALAFLETGAFVGLVAPGESAILIGGVVAGQGQISIYVLIGIVWACAVAGDLTSYTLGRRLGRGFLERHGPRLKITEERLQYVEGFFARRGGITILIGRFIGLVRAIAPFIAGASKMPLRTFLPYDILGAGLWGSLFCLLGYFFWQSLDKVEAYIGTGAAAFSGLVVDRPRDLVRGPLPPRRRVPRQGPAAARAQPRVAARPRPADVRRRPRHASASSSPRCSSLAAVGTLPVLRPRVADRPRHAPARPGRVRRRRRPVHAGARLGHPRRHQPRLVPGHRRRRARHRDLGRAGTAAPSRAPRSSSPTRSPTSPSTSPRTRPTARARPASTPTPRGSPIPPATPPTRSPTSPARSSSPAPATTGRPAAALVTIAIVVAAAVAASRVYLRAHYLSDVIGGLALATAIYALVGARRARHRDGA